MNPLSQGVRLAIPVSLLLMLAGEVAAFSLGEARVLSRKGERLLLEIDLRPAPGERPEAGCFHLRASAPGRASAWTERAALSVGGEAATTLIVRSLEPVDVSEIAFGVQAGCGANSQRDYQLTLREPGEALPVVPATAIARPPTAERVSEQAAKASAVVVQTTAPAATRRLLTDREAADAPLRLAGQLGTWAGEDAVDEKLRNVLRWEYRLLQALHVQASGQLQQLEEQRLAVAGAAEPVSAPPAALPAPAGQTELAPAPAAVPPAPAVATVQPEAKTADPPRQSESALVNWLIALLLAAALAGLAFAAWVWWRPRKPEPVPEDPLSVPTILVDPPRPSEMDDFSAPLRPTTLRLPADEIQAGISVEVYEPGDTPAALPVLQPASGERLEDGEALNPVMELAEIMLSFGRVQGAAQALQDYIRENPEEALQPWIRLMDVYRMAGMRDEFERVGAELNQHFNVEIQHWDDHAAEAPASATRAEPLPIQWPRASIRAAGIEDMPHILDAVLAMWPEQSCVEYLDRLLRDNRGGLRVGLGLPVVQDIMFLLDLLAELHGEAAGNDQA